MKGLAPLILGLFATFAFSWAGLTVIPNFQIGHLDPQTDEEGADNYPVPKSGLADRGRKIYAANGCVYCHSQQVRADYAASDIERKWGERRSAPRDYIFERTAMLGKMRMGPDLANIGKRAPADDENAPPPGAAGGSPANPPVVAGVSPAGPGAPAAPTTASPSSSSAPSASPNSVPAPAASVIPASNTSSAPAPAAPTAAETAAATTSSQPLNSSTSQPSQPAPYSAAWHHQHLYSPRSLERDSNMPAYRFLYEEKRITGQRAADALNLTGPDRPAEGWQVVPTSEAKCLVAYLMSLDQSHPLNEVKSNVPVAPVTGATTPPPAPGKGTK